MASARGARLESALGTASAEFLQELLEFLRIESVSTRGDDMTPATDFLKAALTRAGCAVEVHETSGNPIVLATWGRVDAPAKVLVYGHYDVYPVTEANWASPPFEPRIDGDRIYARGAGDNKGQILAHIHALRLLRSLGLGEGVQVKLLIEGEEEVGSPNLPGFVDEHVDLLAADLCYYADGPMYPGDQPAMIFGARGAIVVDLRVTGASRPLHSGNWGGIAPTPAIELCRLIAELVGPSGDLLFAGATDGVPALTTVDHGAIARLPFDGDQVTSDIGVPPRTERVGEVAYERLMCLPHFNLQRIHAGPVPDGNYPSIPNEAVATVDVRLVGDQDPLGLVERIRAHIESRGFENIEVTTRVTQPASRTPLDSVITEPVRSAVLAGFGSSPLLVPSLGATTPEYVFTKRLGLPTVNVPYAPHDESNHAANESTRKQLYFGGIRTTAHLMMRLADDAGAEHGAKAE